MVRRALERPYDFHLESSPRYSSSLIESDSLQLLRLSSMLETCKRSSTVVGGQRDCMIASDSRDCMQIKYVWMQESNANAQISSSMLTIKTYRIPSVAVLAPNPAEGCNFSMDAQSA